MSDKRLEGLQVLKIRMPAEIRRQKERKVIKQRRASHRVARIGENGHLAKAEWGNATSSISDPRSMQVKDSTKTWWSEARIMLRRQYRSSTQITTKWNCTIGALLGNLLDTNHPLWREPKNAVRDVGFGVFLLQVEVAIVDIPLFKQHV